MIRNLISTAIAAVMCLAAATVSAQNTETHLPNDMFSQYSTANGPSTTTAGIYPAPHYSPSLGAQSYYTYQPLMPHEMMYAHSRNYFNYYNTNQCGLPDSVNKTSVRWISGTNHIAPIRQSHCLSNLTYRLQAHKYGLSDGNCGANDCGGQFGRSKKFFNHGKIGCRGGECGQSSCESGCSANLSDGTLNR